MKKLIGILLLTFSFQALAKVKVKDVEFVRDVNGKTQLQIHYSGKLESEPYLEFGKNHVQIVLPESIVWPKINKKASLTGSQLDVTLMAYQFSRDVVRVRAILPFPTKSIEGNADIRLRKGLIKVNLPESLRVATVPKIKPKKVVPIQRAPKKETVKSDVSHLNEDYLMNLIEEEQKGNEKKAEVDNVSRKMSASKKTRKKVGFWNDSLTSYVMKFAGFLVVVLLLFLGTINFFKKTVTKKGRLSFLNSSQLVEVLNSTPLAPKRTLVLVRAHKQVFLLANTESGVTSLGEVNDLAQILKTGEKEIAGDNFDSLAKSIETVDERIKIKEDPFAEVVSSKESEAKANLQSNFSAQVKSKLKNLKSLQ